MEIRYSPHAVDRMIQRRVSTTEVEDLLLKSDGLIRQSKDKIIVYKKMKGRTDNSLAVVAVARGRNFDVVTVMVNFEMER